MTSLYVADNDVTRTEIDSSERYRLLLKASSRPREEHSIIVVAGPKVSHCCAGRGSSLTSNVDRTALKSHTYHLNVNPHPGPPCHTRSSWLSRSCFQSFLSLS